MIIAVSDSEKMFCTRSEMKLAV